MPPRPAASWPPPAEPRAPATEARRILPRLIEPEPSQVEPERIQVSAERSPKPRRGRPPKAKPMDAEVVEEPIGRPSIKVALTEPAPPSVPRTPTTYLMRIVKPVAILPLGERWKRRLGRWAR